MQSRHEKTLSQRPVTSKSKYNNNKPNMVIFYKKWKKYNGIQLTNNKMDLNIQKMTNHLISNNASIKEPSRFLKFCTLLFFNI